MCMYIYIYVYVVYRDYSCRYLIYFIMCSVCAYIYAHTYRVCFYVHKYFYTSTKTCAKALQIDFAISVY